ncbi:MAG TPA: ROK family protein [Anaerolineales bacterium]|nr:ROK family protein [Anaerolineales bacterium]
MSLIVAVDIGGTHIRAATYEPNSTSPTHHQRNKSKALEPGVFDRLVQTIEAVWPKKDEVAGIGLASPGPLDPHQGVILSTPNIPEWKDFPLAAKLNKHFNVPVHIDNDANLAALGEWKYGAGKGHNDVLYLTISTGIGGGVITNGHLLQGYHGMAAELGHVTIDPDGPLCGCGHPGHLEAFASGPAIARYVNEQLAAGRTSSLHADPKLSAQQVAAAALEGDELARAAFARAGEYLGVAVSNYLHIFDPSVVIFGGGVSQVGDLLFKPFEASLKKRVIHPRYLENLEFTKAALGDDAGLLGALALARLSEEDPP